ncbi:MAG: hypothetical protein JW818_22455, partial [Pirellulales bacterium]|nr:hypothetical protein [Pirellulales bacterium]
MPDRPLPPPVTSLPPVHPEDEEGLRAAAVVSSGLGDQKPPPVAPPVGPEGPVVRERDDLAAESGRLSRGEGRRWLGLVTSAI